MSYDRLSRWYDWLSASSERPLAALGLNTLNARAIETILEGVTRNASNGDLYLTNSIRENEMNKGIISSLLNNILRLLFGLCPWLYRVNLGWLLGKRFLMLTHIEGNSEHLRHVVLEIMYHDVKTGAYVVEAGCTDKTDWVNKLPADPIVQIKTGIQTFKSTAVLTQLDEGGCYLLYLLPLPSNDSY